MSTPFLRQIVLDLEESRIREVANAGMGRPDVLAFWFGESDEVTPDVVRQSAIDSMTQGETFYAHNLGLPELRQALADYTSRLHGPVDAGRFAVTSGGDTVPLMTPEALSALDVDLRLGVRAASLDLARKTVVSDAGDEYRYDGALVIATGVTPRQLPGTDTLENVYTVRTADDVVGLRRELASGRRAVVIGAGFIGAEFAAAATAAWACCRLMSSIRGKGLGFGGFRD